MTALNQVFTISYEKEPGTCLSCGAILDEVEKRYGYCHPCLNEARMEADEE